MTHILKVKRGENGERIEQLTCATELRTCSGSKLSDSVIEFSLSEFSVSEYSESGL